MGLDNGLIIKGKTIKGKEFLNQYCKDIQESYDPSRFELGYWRKCWNIRDMFLSTFKDKGYNGEGGRIYLNIAELVDVVEIMKYFLNEDRWYASGGSPIWSWYEAIGGIAKCIYNIREFLADLEDSGLTDIDFEIYFYDSY